MQRRGISFHIQCFENARSAMETLHKDVGKLRLNQCTDRTDAALQAGILSRLGRSKMYKSLIYLIFTPWFRSQALVKIFGYAN